MGRISVPLVLMRGPDNPFDAVSIALPKSMGGDMEERCLGYLSRRTVQKWGMDSRGRRCVVERLAALSEDGEVHITGTMERDKDPADLEQFRSYDDEVGDIHIFMPVLRLDLPDAQIMGAAIRDFLAEHEDDHAWRLTEEEFTRTPQLRWLHGLRTEIVKRLADEIVTSPGDSQRHFLQVRRKGEGLKVVNEDGGCVGVVRTRLNNLVKVGSEFDRPAVIEALTREGINVAFDPTPGWLNASLEVKDGREIRVRWVGRVAGLNVEPLLASFDLETKELLVFARNLASPVERLIRRAGHVPETVTVRDHPRDPGELFGQDLIARLANLLPGRKLRPEARELIPAQWAEQIDAVWREREEVSARGEFAGTFVVPPRERRPPDDPELPPGLFPEVEAIDDEYPRGLVGCRLCGSKEKPSKKAPYCFDCETDARFRGLFNDCGFKDEPWYEAAVGAIAKLVEIEFGDAPARDQLRTMPKEGPNRDLMVLCRMLAVRSGYTVPGSDRKVGSWTDWLGRAGVLASGIRTGRGVIVTAKDGHLCRSLLERQIDDFFFDQGVEHEPEPFYPFDAEVNRDGFRADWRLADGTFVEALGFINDPEYMAKAHRKMDLAARHNIPVVTVTDADLRNLTTIFAKWLPLKRDRPQRAALVPRASGSAQTPAASAPIGGGRNLANEQSRADRLARSRIAVELQVGGATREQIAEHLGVHVGVVGNLLRDGKFFANPSSDPARLALAEKAASARKRGLNRGSFREEAELSVGKAKECWRDVHVLFGASVKP